MLVIGCDPGERESAMVLYDSDLRTIPAFVQAHNAEIAKVLGNLQQYTERPVAACVLEMPANYGPARGGAPLYMTAYWAGVFARAFDSCPGQPSVVRVTRPEIVLHWCGARSGFTKAQVAAALAERLWGLTPRKAKGTKREAGPAYGFKGLHLWDALALAAWYAETSELPKRKA